MGLEQGGVQVLIGIVATFLLQWLKHQTWFPLLNTWSEKWWKITVSAIVAFCSALGVSFVFNPVMGTLLVTGLTWATISHGVWAFVLSFATQHLAYVVPVIGVKTLMPNPAGGTQ